MKNFKILSFYIFALSVLFFSCLMPYPFFSNTSNISQSHISEINSYWESETSNLYKSKNKMLSLKWSDVDPLLELGKAYQIYDVKTKETYFLKRVGGINHADTVPLSQEDLLTIKKLYKSNDLYNPVLLKINDQTYVPASFNAWQHGYQNHFCLHFLASKTDGTKSVDKNHQKAISIAQKSKLPE